MESVGAREQAPLGETLKSLVAQATTDGWDRRPLLALLENANLIDVAHALSDLETREAFLVFDILPREAKAVVLPEADPRLQAELLMHVGEQSSVELVSALTPDDAVDVLELVREPEREQIIERLDAGDARTIEELRRYGPSTAGGLMTTSLIQVPPTATPESVLERIRQQTEAETVNIVYVTDAGRLVGVLSIRDVIRAPLRKPVSEVMTYEVISVPPESPQEDVVRVMETYHLGAVPVVDARGLLLGIVTSDDALTAQEREGTRDVMAMAGAGTSLTFPTRQGVLERVRARIPWLLVTLGGGMMASWVIQGVSSWLGNDGAVGDLGRFLPIVAGMAGNVAMQSAAVMVRGFATGEIVAARVPKIIVEEVLVGSLSGILCGIVAAIIARTTGVPVRLCIAIGISIFCATTLAGASGTVIPAACVRMKIDPAISAGPFITTLNDLLGFFIYMVVAISMLGRVSV